MLKRCRRPHLFLLFLFLVFSFSAGGETLQVQIAKAHPVRVAKVNKAHHVKGKKAIHGKKSGKAHHAKGKKASHGKKGAKKHHAKAAKSDEVSYFVAELNSGKILLSQYPERPMPPASTMKLVTTYAALLALGSNYQWTTRFRTMAPVKGGHLMGDLYWQGSGDPMFGQADLNMMLLRLTQLGIHAIDGQLVLLIPPGLETITTSGFKSDRGRIFALEPMPHNLAFKLLNFYFDRDARGRPTLSVDPPLPDSMLTRHIEVTPRSACGGLKPYLHYSWKNNHLTLSGRIPIGCLGESLAVNLLSPEEFIFLSFASYWRAWGNLGPFGVITQTSLPAGRILALHHSPPLKTVIIAMNKHSNNLIAKSIFLEVGKKQNLPAALAVKRTLTASGLNPTGLVLENGSGLSREERITARDLGELLLRSAKKPFFSDFLASLPIGGVDGTLKHRFFGHPELRLKTGTLNNVTAVAGYYLPANSREKPLVIVVLVKRNGRPFSLNAFDRMVLSLIDAAQKEVNNPATDLFQ